MYVILLCWVLLALVFVAFGKLCESDFLLGVGVVMMFMTMLVNNVT